MGKEFSEPELRQMEISILNRLKYLHKTQIEIENFKRYYELIDNFVSQLSYEEYTEYFDILLKIENKLHYFNIDLTPFEFNNKEFLRLKYLIKELLSKCNKLFLLNEIIIRENHFMTIDIFMR